MTDVKHTPGPLVAQPEPGYTPDSLYMVVDASEPSGATVCTASYCTKADAHLYAAAPDLLEALKGMTEQVCSHFRFAPWEDHSTCADRRACKQSGCAIARAAIAKAEGAR